MLKVEHTQGKGQLKRLQKLGGEREGKGAKASVTRLEEGAKGTDNTVPAILEGVENYCTLGEICQVFREVFGEQQQLAAF